jgi:hypothetical protein
VFADDAYWPVVLWQNASQASNECMQVDWGVPDADALAQRCGDQAITTDRNSIGSKPSGADEEPQTAWIFDVAA